MYRITDYSNFYKELPNIVFADKHWILDILLDSKKKNKKLKTYFKNPELSEKNLSFLLFRNFIPRDALYDFIDWLRRGPLYDDKFFSYNNVFGYFNFIFFQHALKIRRSPGFDFEEIPIFITELADHGNLGMDILFWSEKLFGRTTYDLRFAEGGPAGDIPVLQDRSRW